MLRRPQAVKTLDGSELDIVQDFKYLGAWIASVNTISISERPRHGKHETVWIRSGKVTCPRH
jgi:hypothetical protein